MVLFALMLLSVAMVCAQASSQQVRERISINEDWYFFKYDSITKADKLIYDVRPAINNLVENKIADAKPTEAAKVETEGGALKAWILPSGNRFIKDPNNKHARPAGNPGSDFPFVQQNFNDAAWQKVNLPHDWAINGPFMAGPNPEVGGGMGRLPSNGVAWYRKNLDIPPSDTGKSIFLDIDGAMSYAMVWLNGNLVGGWPYGYNSWRLDLTPYIIPGSENQLAIRLDNPNYSARWYPGGGIYRNVWLTKTNPVHVSQYGTFITTENVSTSSANVKIEVSIDNDTQETATVTVLTQVYSLDKKGNRSATAVKTFPSQSSTIPAGSHSIIQGSITLKNPKLWGPPPTQQPNLYAAVTTIVKNGKTIDHYETRFGIRSIEFNADKGFIINGERVQLKGVNQHHDLGALGAAFNTRAAERQLEILREMGCNAIRMSHNPPAPELLELTDRMGFLVIN
ncbi:MAG TPA: glycoside hydrolase family 2 TIM barrel-domain containing protein, partial [Cyclobacteriaceae bacterium]|nr:glycoside hydrolase family 2 TIM barrel-domain containing protein [Cyclobacteriaceae bacterium]